LIQNYKLNSTRFDLRTKVVNPVNPAHICSPFKESAFNPYETYISTIAQEKKEQARIPRAHGYGQRTQGFGKPQEKRPQETYRF